MNYKCSCQIPENEEIRDSNERHMLEIDELQERISEATPCFSSKDGDDDAVILYLFNMVLLGSLDLHFLTAFQIIRKK